MIRTIIRIDEQTCNGCTLCATACHEGAIGMVDGKAVLLRDDYCDGLGDCLPVCPTGAITFEQREALPYNEAAVQANLTQQTKAHTPCPLPTQALLPIFAEQQHQWPLQLRLFPVQADFLKHANLLVAADCAAYAAKDFHQAYAKDKVIAIGCPKLDATDYKQILTAIIQTNPLNSLTIIHMEVPCCTGLAKAVQEALKQSVVNLPCQIITLDTKGNPIHTTICS